MLPEPDASAPGRAWSAGIDQFDTRVVERRHQFHERIDIATDDAITGFHTLDRRHREVRQDSHLPLIDVQERARGPELIGGNHEGASPLRVRTCLYHVNCWFTCQF